MKDIHPAPDADDSDDADPWVEQGLRALREQVPSDESRRATLAQLGIADVGTARQPAVPAPRARHALVPWLVTGALLGLIALVLRRWLG
jgi:hypothetical protein